MEARARIPRTRSGLVAVAAILLLLVPVCGGSEDDAAVVAILRAVPGGGDGADPFAETLREGGWVVGENLTILASDPSETHTSQEDIAAAIRRWRDAGVELIFAQSSSGARAAADAAPDVPVVFLVNDPVAVGLLEHEDRPEGNLTGVTFRSPEDRTVDLARRAIEDLETVGYLFPSDDPASAPHLAGARAATRQLGLRFVAESFASSDEVARAVRRLARRDADVLFIANAPTAIREVAAIGRATERHRLPIIANTDRATSALIVIFPDTDELLRQAGRQTARLLNGAEVAQVPVEDPRHYIVQINAEAGRRIGVRIPRELYREADIVIR